MIGNLIGIILLTPTVLAQFDLKPDVSFTENNDRFDLTGMMQAHPASRDAPLLDDIEDEIQSEEDFRRSLNRRFKDIDALKQINLTANTETRKSNAGFAYDDRMDSNEGGSVSDFVESLKAFEHNVEPPNRRRRDVAPPNRRRHDVAPPNRRRRDVASNAHRRSRRNADQYVLSQYGFPIVLKVDGYLKPPLE